MRILLSCLQDLRPHRIPAYRFWADHFRHGITEAGNEWAEVPGVDWAEGISGLSAEALCAWRDRTWSKTLRWVEEEMRCGRPVDLFMGYLYPEQVEPAALAELRRLGIPCVNFFCDNVRQFTRVPAVYGGFDLHWVPEFKALAMYARAGLRVCHAPMPLWVPPALRCPGEETIAQTTFIGSHDLLRQELLGRALQAGARIRIGGAGWKRTAEMTDEREVSRGPSRWLATARNQVAFVQQHGWEALARKTFWKAFPAALPSIPEDCLLPAVDASAYVRLTRESEITLGINRVPSFHRPRRRPETYSRLRDLEAPMMGACYLTEWTAGLDELYEIGTEIEVYRTSEELTDKIRFLEAHSAVRKKLRAAGQKRATSCHTVPKTLERISRQLRQL